MPVKVLSTAVNSTTVASAWTKLFQGGEHGSRNGTVILNLGTSTIYVSVVPRGSAAPASLDTVPLCYKVYAGDTYPLGAYADSRSDIYVADENFAGGVAYNAWEVVN